MAHILSAPVRFWKCPACGCTDRTQLAQPHTQFHDCPAMNGAGLPLIEVQYPDARVPGRQLLVPSEYGPGNAAVRTERLDGSNDVTVFPAPATATIES